jgi:hypothetical protein
MNFKMASHTGWMPNPEAANIKLTEGGMNRDVNGMSYMKNGSYVEKNVYFPFCFFF